VKQANSEIITMKFAEKTIVNKNHNKT